jgi:hypothetical protein
MVYARAGDALLDYAPCRYGTSRLTFRGPPRPLDAPYVAVLGGTESYGRFVARPWPALVEDAISVPVVNLACVNAGADAWLVDPGALQVAQGARAAVLQVTGAVNLTNPFYAVHPRRNDRFVRALPPLVQLYPEVDFSGINFTRHLMLTLRRVSPDRFATVAAALRRTWVQRTQALLDGIGAPAVLLWMATRPPGPPRDDLGPDPLLVDEAMVAAVRPRAADLVQVVRPAPPDPVQGGLRFDPFDRIAAEGLPGVEAHAAAAQAVAAALARLA